MNELLATLDRLPVQETAFAVLILIVALLALLSLAFAFNVLVLRILNERTARRWARLESLWEGPLLAALADPERLPAVYELVDDRHRVQFVDFVLRWSRRIRGRDQEVLKKAALPYLDVFVDDLDASRVELRTRAVQMLGSLGLPTYAEAVVRALDDPSPLVSMVAARALARTREPRHATEILTRLPRFREWNRNFLASMLASMGPEAVPALQATAGDRHQAPWVRAVAVDALRHLSEPESADVAAEIVARESDREVLAAALRLLAEVGRLEHRDVVRARTRSNDFVIRAHALSALGTLAGQDEVPLLEEALDDPSPWVAIHAAEGLHTAGADEALEAFARSGHPRAELARQVLMEEGGDLWRENAP